MTDQELKQHVQSAMDWEPSLDASDIGLAVHESVVTLRGTVRSYHEKLMAERVALRVFGVKAVANDLIVHIATGFERNDTEIAQAAVSALKWNIVVPNDQVTVSVSNGWVTLNGTLDWQYQKDAAERVVRELTGVKGITNNISLVPRVKATDVREKIEAAFKRSAEIDARRINVTAQEGKIILSGTVHSWAERREAERAAWAAPGVKTVEDRLSVTP
jgi:osmotically-inducible protein OsmY